jgi:ribosomal peptide maturation radical SAM protein 1
MKDDRLVAVVRDCDALLIVPPFAGLDRPSLGAHLLQACARREGFEVAVLYANLALASRIGEPLYQTIAYGPTGALLGERFFCAAAYEGVPLFGREAATCAAVRRSARLGSGANELRREEIAALAADAADFADDAAMAVAARRINVVGASTTFEQTAASYAILSRIKALRPHVTTILGGANCEGDMGRGLRTMLPAVDVVFSGECESTFPKWLRSREGGPLIAGAPCIDLDALPRIDYREYYEQRETFLPDSCGRERVWLPYESSRGCWWGEKHHCTFCGLNGETMALRQKSADTVIADLTALLADHPTKLVCMADNIMPFGYFHDLLPRLSAELPDAYLFYEQKANLSLAQVRALKDSGVREIQPGIEALSTPLLRLMDKGVSARQNVMLLRYARSVGLTLTWNLLYALPGDDIADYQRTLAVVRRIGHLQPPNGLSHLSIDRFSPYFNAPKRYGIGSISPMPAYEAVLPEGAPVESIAYHFVGEYETGSDGDDAVMVEIGRTVDEWIDSWSAPDRTAPALAVEELDEDLFIIVDTRGLVESIPLQFLTREQARLVLRGAPATDADGVAWAIDCGLLLEIDGWLVPLATANPELLAAMEEREMVRRAVA